MVLIGTEIEVEFEVKGEMDRDRCRDLRCNASSLFNKQTIESFSLK